MRITKFIFSQDVKRAKEAKRLLLTISEDLADLNSYPLYLPRYFGEEDKSKTHSKLAKNLRATIKLYESGINNIGFDKFLNYIQRNFHKVYFFAERNNSITLDNLVIQVVIKEVSELFLSIDDYILIKPLKEKVFCKIKNLKLDKYNLVAIDKKFHLEKDGIIYDRKFLIYYHPFLRRFYTSNFTELTFLLKEISSNKKGIQLSLAIDPKRLSSPKNIRRIFEFDYWRGPKFSNKELNKNDYYGVVIYKRLSSPYALDVWPIDRTEFFIKNTKEGLKEIEIEEINPVMRYSKRYVLQKYAHLIWSKQRGYFSHLDVAVKVYSRKEHLKRAAYEWKPKKDKEEAKILEKIKLFRIDGEISIHLTMQILGDFYRYNELIKEFFSGQ